MLNFPLDYNEKLFMRIDKMYVQHYSSENCMIMLIIWGKKRKKCRRSTCSDIEISV